MTGVLKIQTAPGVWEAASGGVSSEYVDNNHWNTAWGTLAKTQGAGLVALTTAFANASAATVTLQAGRQYVVTYSTRAVDISTANTSFIIQLISSAVTLTSNDKYFLTSTATSSLYSGSAAFRWLLNGDGLTHTLTVQVRTVAGTGTFHSQAGPASGMTVEDIGPVTRLPVGVQPPGPDWSAFDQRYVNITGDQMEGPFTGAPLTVRAAPGVVDAWYESVGKQPGYYFYNDAYTYMGGLYMDEATPTRIKADQNILMQAAQANDAMALTRKSYVDLLANDVAPAVARWITVGGTDSTYTLNSGWGYFIAVCCPPCTIDGLGCEVTGAAGAGGVVRLGIYANHATRIEPATLLRDAGTVVSTTTGWKSIAITPTVHNGGWLWLALAAQVAGCTIRTTSGHGEPWVLFGTGPQVPPGLAYRSWTSPSFNGAFPATITDIGVAAQLDPKIAFKTSA